ncbi:unnamed protein product [Sphagnum balticum]
MKTTRLLLALTLAFSTLSLPGFALSESENKAPVAENTVNFADEVKLDQAGESCAFPLLGRVDGAPSDPLQGCTIEDSATEDGAVAPSVEPMKVGSRFPIKIDSSLTSKTAKVGDSIEARLSEDLIIGGKLIAPQGSKVKGHVSSVQQGRRVLKAEFSRHRWLKSAGELGVQFDEIVTDKDEHFPLVAKPARQTRFVKDMEEGRVLGINNDGEIVSPLSAQVKSQAIHLGIHAAVTAAGISGGPIGLAAIPVTYGCLGAISPSFAFMHPVGRNMKHRRLKGFALGFVSGLPGGGFVADAIVRGPEAIVKPGDLFEAELKQEFKGEQAVVANVADAEGTAEIVPVVKKTVQGEVLPRDPAVTIAN